MYNSAIPEMDEPDVTMGLRNGGLALKPKMVKQPGYMHGGKITMPKQPGYMYGGKVKMPKGYRKGGTIGDVKKDDGTDKVDVKAREGEYFLNPETVAHIGGGDYKQGVRNLNAVVRQATGKEPGPVPVGKDGRQGFATSGGVDPNEEFFRRAAMDRMAQAKAEARGPAASAGTIYVDPQGNASTSAPKSTFEAAGSADVGKGVRQAAGRAVDVVRNALPSIETTASGLRKVGKVAAPAAGALDALEVGKVAFNPDATSNDLKTEIASKAGKWGTAGLLAVKGGAAGAALGGPLAPVTGPLGAIAGGVTGYFAGDKLIEGGRALLGTDTRDPSERLAAERSASLRTAAAPVADAAPAAPAAPAAAPRDFDKEVRDKLAESQARGSAASTFSVPDAINPTLRQLPPGFRGVDEQGRVTYGDAAATGGRGEPTNVGTYNVVSSRYSPSMEAMAAERAALTAAANRGDYDAIRNYYGGGAQSGPTIVGIGSRGSTASSGDIGDMVKDLKRQGIKISNQTLREIIQSRTSLRNTDSNNETSRANTIDSNRTSMRNTDANNRTSRLNNIDSNTTSMRNTDANNATSMRNTDANNRTSRQNNMDNTFVNIRGQNADMLRVNEETRRAQAKAVLDQRNKNTDDLEKMIKERFTKSFADPKTGEIKESFNQSEANQFRRFVTEAAAKASKDKNSPLYGVDVRDISPYDLISAAPDFQTRQGVRNIVNRNAQEIRDGAVSSEQLRPDQIVRTDTLRLSDVMPFSNSSAELFRDYIPSMFKNKDSDYNQVVEIKEGNKVMRIPKTQFTRTDSGTSNEDILRQYPALRNQPQR